MADWQEVVRFPLPKPGMLDAAVSIQVKGPWTRREFYKLCEVLEIVYEAMWEDEEEERQQRGPQPTPGA